jgi:hypothetical protein
MLAEIVGSNMSRLWEMKESQNINGAVLISLIIIEDINYICVETGFIAVKKEGRKVGNKERQRFCAVRT